MRTPVLLLGAAALFWGHESGRLWLAVPIALTLEARHFVPTRWDVAPAGVQRVADLCTWAFLIAAGYLTISKGMPVPILAIVQWLPVVLLPLVLVQLYGTKGSIELSALFLSLRREPADALAHARVDLGMAFVIVCVLAAGAANARTPVYFLGTAALSLWALWSVRPGRQTRAAWVAVALASAGVGYAGQIGLANLQGWILNLAIEYLNADLQRTDPYRATTDLGHLGELKLSDRIVLRVSLPADAALPFLLHRASYNAYGGTTWLARDAAFEALRPAGDGSVWRLAAGIDPAGIVDVSETLRSGRGVLSLPAGTAEVVGPGIVELRRNALGTVQIERPPGAVTYRARFGAPGAPEGGPTPQDLRVPAQEAEAVEQVVRELGLRMLAPEAAVRTLQRHFASGYRYSTYRADHVVDVSALADFLHRTKSGHCEYFASATVLVARAAGIPARYATGYSVQERSTLEGRFVVRERHAHAWARLHVGGVWRDVDTTPPQWFDEEARAAPAWEPLRDLWSWLAWSVAAWRAGDGERGLPAWTLWALLPLFALLAWRVHRTGGFSRARTAGAPATQSAGHAGAGSAFYRIEARVAALACARAPHEPLGEWLDRARQVRPDLDLAGARRLLALHYRLRFDPAGLGPAEQVALGEGVERWLALHRQSR